MRRLRVFLGFLLGGKLCWKCGQERTGYYLRLPTCDTCYYVDLINALKRM